MIGYIYFIINNENKQRYVGQTADFTRRKAEHLNDLRNHTHVNDKLQRAWNKYGEANFSFEYNKYELENKDELNILEKAFIQQYDSFNNGYNLTLGGDGGNTRGKLSFDDYCLVYIGCQWKGMTEKIGKYLEVDSAAISAILREVAYLWYKEDADNLSLEEKQRIQLKFREIFGIAENKVADENRVPTHLSEDDYFYCLCIASSYGRGIESALAKFFNKHKSFLSNGIKGKASGKVYNALQRFKKLTVEKVLQIGQQKFEEWKISEFTNSKFIVSYNDKWRN